jgi:hypothetical protein
MVMPAKQGAVTGGPMTMNWHMWLVVRVAMMSGLLWPRSVSDLATTTS